MRNAIIIGSGISGMSCAIKLAEAGVKVLLVSPYPSERAQSVMAAGGINAVLDNCETGDSVACHIEDTLRGGCCIAGKSAVRGLCEGAEGIIKFLEQKGTVFSVDESGEPARRAFGGQSFRRTCYSGSSTGKQIVSALVMEVRRYEASGLIKRRLRNRFHSALIKDGTCFGVLLFDEPSGKLIPEYADAVVIATGGQNALFGRTTGSQLCDGYAAGKLFMQGAELKNLEFIQYHPTTIETAQKKMLISEAVRGEGGRLFYLKDGERVYFMEDKYGPGGNLLTRDVISREIYSLHSQAYLDISFIGKDEIDRRIPEVRDICLKYRNIDITKDPIPVVPSVHFFMGGLAVHLDHETNINNLFAVGECASMYHGANRLGGNSLLAALYSGMKAAGEIASRNSADSRPDFTAYIKDEERSFNDPYDERSQYPAKYIRDSLADAMDRDLGIVRNEKNLAESISDIDFDLSIVDKINYDPTVSRYETYSLKGILSLARATFTCALERKESRGAHYREDYPKTDDAFAAATIISYDNGGYKVRLDREECYES